MIFRVVRDLSNLGAQSGWVGRLCPHAMDAKGITPVRADVVSCCKSSKCVLRGDQSSNYGFYWESSQGNLLSHLESGSSLRRVVRRLIGRRMPVHPPLRLPASYSSGLAFVVFGVQSSP